MLTIGSITTKSLNGQITKGAYGNGLYVLLIANNDFYNTIDSEGVVAGHTLPTGWVASNNRDSFIHTGFEFLELSFSGSLAAPYANSGIIRSEDGINWTTHAFPEAGLWNALAYNPNTSTIVAIQNGVNGGLSTAFSTDGGVTWSLGGDMPSAIGWNSVTYSHVHGGFLAVPIDSVTPALSLDDGATWQLTNAIPTYNSATVAATEHVSFISGTRGGAATTNAVASTGGAFTQLDPLLAEYMSVGQSAQHNVIVAISLEHIMIMSNATDYQEIAYNSLFIQPTNPVIGPDKVLWFFQSNNTYYELSFSGAESRTLVFAPPVLVAGSDFWDVNVSKFKGVSFSYVPPVGN